MPGCIHREDSACPFCRSKASAALLLGLSTLAPGCVGGAVALYGVEIVDDDNDGWGNFEDCDDSDPAINPDAEDSTVDGVDQNCDGTDGPTDSGM